MYSDQLMALFHSRSHGGELEDATHFGQAGEPGGGPWIQFWLRVERETVRTARWRTFGCPAAIACSEAVCAWSEGRTLQDLRLVTAETVTEWVGTVPEGKEHCPELAVQAMRAVILT